MSAGQISGFDAEFAAAVATPQRAAAYDAAYHEGPPPAASPPGGRQRLDLTPDVMRDMAARHAQIRAAEQPGRAATPVSPPFFSPPTADVSPVQPPQPPPPPQPSPTVHVQGLTERDIDAKLAPLHKSLHDLAANVAAITDYLNMKHQQEQQEQRPKAAATVVFGYDDFGDLEAFAEEVIVPPESLFVIVALAQGEGRSRFLPRAGRSVLFKAPAYGLSARMVPIGCDWEAPGRHYVVLMRDLTDAETTGSAGANERDELAADAAQAQHAVAVALAQHPDARTEPATPLEGPPASLVD